MLEEGVQAVTCSERQMADGWYYLDPEEADPMPGHGPFPGQREAILAGVNHEAGW